MKNTQKGFIVPLVIGIVAVLIIAGAYFVYKNESGQGEEADQASGQFLTSTTTNYTSTTTQPAPVITSINPSSGPIGTIVELKGSNLAGFEGELDAWIENSNGEKAFLPGIGSVPRADQTIRVKIDSQLCKENLSYKGGQCSSYMTITPGTYRIYTYPWGNISNTVQFVVTASASQVNSSQPSITVLSPKTGDTLVAGSVKIVNWNSTNLTSSDHVNIWLIDNVNSSPNYQHYSQELIHGTINDGSEPITLPTQLSGPFELRVQLTNGRDNSGSSYITITPSTTNPSITVLSPNGGDVWKMGQTYTISYAVNGNVGPMTIKLDRYSDDGTLIQSIDIGTSDTNSFIYKVPLTLEDTKGVAGRYKIEIYPATGRELVKRSDYFSIIR